VLNTVLFLLSVNVLSNSISANFFLSLHLFCCKSVIRQLSRIVPNNGDSHKSSMYQNVQTCILQVNCTRIGIKLPLYIVYYVRSSLPHATR